MPRKIIQIATAACPGLSDDPHPDLTHTLIYALADDGTLWLCGMGNTLTSWRLMPPIPQPGEGAMHLAVLEEDAGKKPT